MNEIPNILEKQEKVEWEGKPKYAPYITRSLVVPIVVFVVVWFVVSINNAPFFWYILAGIVSVGIIFLTYLGYRVTHYAITNKRIVVQSGIIGRDFKSIDYDKIQNLSLVVGLLGIIFKAGTIKISTGETTTTSKGGTIAIYDDLQYIPEPRAILQHLQEHLSERKEKLYSGKA